jgi:hypothetical protein
MASIGESCDEARSGMAWQVVSPLGADGLGKDPTELPDTGSVGLRQGEERTGRDPHGGAVYGKDGHGKDLSRVPDTACEGLGRWLGSARIGRQGHRLARLGMGPKGHSVIW